MSIPITAAPVDRAELETKVKQIYRAVAQNPAGHYHFPMGRSLAEQLGYPPALLDLVPAGAVESFAGVGYIFDLADLTEGEEVLDLGSGSGIDAFVAALTVGPGGRVVGLDMTEEQNAKAETSGRRRTFPRSRSPRAASRNSPSATQASTASSPMASSTSPRINKPPSARRHASCGPADAWPSPTSSPKDNSPLRSSATPTCGPPASAAPPRPTPTNKRSPTAGSSWKN